MAIEFTAFEGDDEARAVTISAAATTARRRCYSQAMRKRPTRYGLHTATWHAALFSRAMIFAYQ